MENINNNNNYGIVYTPVQDMNESVSDRLHVLFQCRNTKQMFHPVHFTHTLTNSSISNISSNNSSNNNNNTFFTLLELIPYFTDLFRKLFIYICLYLNI